MQPDKNQLVSLILLLFNKRTEINGILTQMPIDQYTVLKFS